MLPYNATIRTLVTLSKKLIIYLDLQLLSTVSKLKILLTTASDYQIKWKNSLILDNSSNVRSLFHISH